MSGRAKVLVAAALGLVALLCAAASASAATPGWECVPTTAGQAVVSGGTGSAPSCGAGTTPVLAPTYVASGVGGKPTVQLSAVNLQILNGAGQTSTLNGEGNLVLGYDETPGRQTGSHDLVLGRQQTFSGYGEIVAGVGNHVSGNLAVAFGHANTASGSYAVTAGDSNTARATAATALGGYGNTVAGAYGALLGGCSNLVGTGTVSEAPICSDATGHAHDFATVAGGAANQAQGQGSSILGGHSRTLSGMFDSQAGPTVFSP